MLKKDIIKTLRLVNGMEKKGVIGRYAIGGALGTIYWTEPWATKDLDIFLTLPTSGEGILLMPFFNYLVKKGYPFKDQYIQIGSVKLDFIGVYNPLTEEALRHAIEATIYEIPTRVLGPEYLLVIAVQTGRRQDLVKAERLYQQSKLDEGLLKDILTRHNLLEKWNEFKKGLL